MSRTAPLPLALLLLGLTVQPSAAALEIVLTVSPAEGVVGQPVEVLVRTFAPIGTEGIELPDPSLAYPVASGVYNILYPVADYPFDVVATPATGDGLTVVLTRDGIDATLWRGSFTPTATGLWSVRVRNFPAGWPGSSATVMVRGGEATRPGSALAVNLLGTLFAGVAVGVILGVGIREWRRRSPLA